MSSTSRAVPAILPARAARAACCASHGAFARTVREPSSTRPGYLARVVRRRSGPPGGGYSLLPRADR
ncbi:hypothetical protein HMPREF1980_01005 [Actinomyces sp. oral taxon 172 str. F0311]|nr:hypothetical protein HMPREF1980_01005 [Actinomyces sp. oral taxon 172 str. F0311]